MRASRDPCLGQEKACISPRKPGEQRGCLPAPIQPLGQELHQQHNHRPWAPAGLQGDPFSRMRSQPCCPALWQPPPCKGKEQGRREASTCPWSLGSARPVLTHPLTILLLWQLPRTRQPVAGSRSPASPEEWGPGHRAFPRQEGLRNESSQGGINY